jgi:hypothetical protein
MWWLTLLSAKFVIERADACIYLHRGCEKEKISSALYSGVCRQESGTLSSAKSRFFG